MIPDPRCQEHAASGEDAVPLDYFHAVHAAFLEAVQRTGEDAGHVYTIAGRTVRLSFAGPALVPAMTRAFARRADPASPVELTVHLWDSKSTGVPLPAIPWRGRDQLARGSVLGYNTRRMKTAFQGERDSISMMDQESQRAVYWTRSAREVPPYEAASPLQAILHWFLQSHRLQRLHAGAVGASESGVLLAGKGGSGKSTTALACLEYGLQYAGDNYVALAPGPHPYAWSLYSSAGVGAESLRLLPHLRAAVSDPDRIDAKAVIFLQDRYPDRLATRVPVDAVVLPVVTDHARSRLVRASRAEALRALAPSSIFQAPDPDAATFQSIVDLVRQIPSYRLEIGWGSLDAPGLIAEILAGQEHYADGA